jgi:hypothetical protein
MHKKVILSDIVHTVVDPRVNNGEDVAMAFVTRVNEVAGEERLNLRVLLDTGADLRFSNVRFTNKRPTEDDEDTPRTVEGVQRVAFWPTR